ncbi:MAG: transposase [Mobilitalea sp.]
MKILPQIMMFDYTQNEEVLGDLERLKKVIDNIPDGKLIHRLNETRGKGRNDWPIVSMWHAVLAGIVFQHTSDSELLRELNRNSQLRDLCGFVPKTERQKNGTYKIFVAPTASAYSRFLKHLIKCQNELNEIFQNLVKYMYENLEDFGELLALDGKAVQSYARNYSDKKEEDGRRDTDANWGTKKYTQSTNSKGEKVIKKVNWFGYRIHLIVDATYELPVEFKVTPASNSEKTEAKEVLKMMSEEKLEKCKYFTADKGYDDTKIIEYLESKDISPIIDICNKWKDGEKTKQYKDTDIVYTYDGKVYYVNDKAEQIKLRYLGYDKSSDSQRYGFYPQNKDNRVFRIPLNTDRRIFVPVARDSKKWKRIYKTRTSVERVNGRIDRDYQFEEHTIRGMKKMNMYITITFITMLSMAKSKIETNNNEHLGALIS